MSGVLFGERIRWAVAATVAIAIVAAAGFLFRLDPPATALAGSSAATVVRPAVQMARAAATDPVLREETEIRDLRPLFLPTKFNATLPEPRREAGRTFLDNETPKFGFSEAELSLARDLPPVVTLNGKAAEDSKATDLLALDGTGTGLAGFGRGQAATSEMKPRGGFVEVVATANGGRVMAEILPVEARPPGDKAWEPLEFLAAVNAAGLAAPLVVTASSRIEEVDAHFRDFLTRRYRIGDRLPPGFYRIVVGP